MISWLTWLTTLSNLFLILKTTLASVVFFRHQLGQIGIMPS